MKSLTYIFLFLVGYAAGAQQIDYNLKKGFIAEGYDITEYFNNKAVAGNSTYTLTHDGAKYKFANQANLNTFKANPTQFIPQYGGYCAYAIADNGKKVDINPKTYEIRDGKLYLFYNKWGVNTLESWIEEGAEKLKNQADIAWANIQYK